MTGYRRRLLLAVAVALAALFVRLGFWQLDRLQQRAALEDAVTVRSGMEVLDWTRAAESGGVIPTDTAGVVWRRARVAGRYDRGGEIVLRGRSSPEGRPGVELLTPLRVADGTLMVLRGWLPAADALRPDLDAAWPAEPGGGVVTVEGLLVPPADGRAGRPVPIESDGVERIALAGADLGVIAEHVAGPLAPVILRVEDGGLETPGLAPPRALVRGDGPHLSYAIQWFSFAAITLVGTAALLVKEGRR